MASQMPLLPELWEHEIIKVHLANCAVRTRVMLRRTCRFLYTHCPPPVPDPVSALWLEALACEIGALVAAQCVHAVGWTLFGYRYKAIHQMGEFYPPLALPWLRRGRLDVYWTMRQAYGFFKRNADYNRWAHYEAAVESHDLTVVCFLLAHDREDALEYYASALAAHAIEVGSWSIYQWLMDNHTLSLNHAWNSVRCYRLLCAACVRCTLGGDMRWMDALVAHWERRLLKCPLSARTNAHKELAAEVERVQRMRHTAIYTDMI